MAISAIEQAWQRVRKDVRARTRTVAPPVAASSALLNRDGSPIGLQRYCELVTPEWHWEWAHLRAMDAIFDRVTAGDLKFVILSVPPRHGKTEKATIRQPAYRLELNPALRIILAAYNAKTARKFSRKIRRIVRGRLALSTERQAAEDWETEEGGGVRAAGVGEGIAGLPGDLILVDDPIKNAEEADSQAFRDRVWEWYTEDVYTRLEPGGAIVITMTRRNEDDLVGRILASEDGANWTVIRLPAIAESEDDPIGRQPGEALCPARYDEKALARIKRVVGTRTWSSLYQQRPAPAEGYVFKTDWFRFYTTRDRPIINADGTRVPVLPDVWSAHAQSWDMSFKDKASSDKVCGLFGSRLGADIYVRDYDNQRRDFVSTIAAVRAMTERHKGERPEAHRKLVEDKANGPAIISALRHSIQGLIAVEPYGDKVSRAYAVTPVCESGNVWLPHPQIAPWVPRFLLSLAHFPFGAEDDDVDAFTQLVRQFIRETGDPLATQGSDETSEAAKVAGQRF